MEKTDALASFAALSQETRLDAFRLLVTAGPDGMAAGQIAQELRIPANTLSFHLSGLKAAGLVACRRDGRSLIYAVDYATLRALQAFLSENCCARGKE